jgi:PAS domain-containing protein
MVLEYRINKADTGEITWIARRAQMLRDSEGNPARMLGTVHDYNRAQARRRSPQVAE